MKLELVVGFVMCLAELAMGDWDDPHTSISIHHSGVGEDPSSDGDDPSSNGGDTIINDLEETKPINLDDLIAEYPQSKADVITETGSIPMTHSQAPTTATAMLFTKTWKSTSKMTCYVYSGSYDIVYWFFDLKQPMVTKPNIVVTALGKTNKLVSWKVEKNIVAEETEEYELQVDVGVTGAASRGDKPWAYCDNPNTSIRDNPNTSIRDNPNTSIRDNPNTSIRDNPNTRIRDNPNTSIRDNPNTSLRDNPNTSLRDNPYTSIRIHRSDDPIINDLEKTKPINLDDLIAEYPQSKADVITETGSIPMTDSQKITTPTAMLFTKTWKSTSKMTCYVYSGSYNIVYWFFDLKPKPNIVVTALGKTNKLISWKVEKSKFAEETEEYELRVDVGVTGAASGGVKPWAYCDSETHKKYFIP